MTSVNLDPIVGQKLNHFKRRRVQLLLARGISVGLLTFLLSFSIVAFIDWYWLLSDSTRWTLTICSYAFVAASVWFASLSRISRRPTNEQAAVLMESSEPELRENLLSAVELATDQPESIHDSPVFRGLLQGKVAHQMGHVEVNKLLPLRLVAKWMGAALLVASVVGVLLLAGDSRIRKLAVRALMPGANIERISRIQVKVLSPSPASLMMAEDETVAIIVEVSGGNVQDVTLETYTPSQGVLKQPMTGRSKTEFSSNVHLTDEPVEYRIFAGDAITQRFVIDTKSRPHVTSFEKTHIYPEYTLLPLKQVTENHGDLIALAGTKTKLLLKVDQAVSSAELIISPIGSDEIQTIPLNQVDGKLEGEVTIDEPAVYKIHLVSEETGFENIFAPKFEIRPVPDLIPKAGFVGLTDDTLLLPANDILKLRGMAEDDLPLDKLTQEISINGAEWATFPITASPVVSSEGRKLEAEWQWDLLRHRLKAGDQVTTKLVAVDRKGNRGESVPLRIIVMEIDFDPDRHQTMLRKIGLYDDLLSFTNLIKEQESSALELVEKLQTADQFSPHWRTDLISLRDNISKQKEEAHALFKKSIAVAKAMPAGVDAYDLDLTARVIARIQHDHANQALQLTQQLGAENKTARKASFKALRDRLKRIADDAKSLSHHYLSFATHDFMANIASDLDSINKQQIATVNNSMDSWDRLKRQQDVVMGRLNQVAQLIEPNQSLLPKHIQGQLAGLTSWINRELETFQELSESDEHFSKLKRAATNLMQQLASKQRYDLVDGGLPQRLVGARRDFDNRSGSLYIPLMDTANATRESNRLRNLPAEQQPEQAEQTLMREMEVTLRHEPSLEQFRSRRTITQSRADADSQYAADLGLTYRAATHLLAEHKLKHPQSQEHSHLAEVAPAYRTLEAGHELKRTLFSIGRLISLERWTAQGNAAFVDNPRQWDAIKLQLEFAIAKLRHAQLNNKLVDRLDRLRWSGAISQADKKIGERRWKRDSLNSAVNELSELQVQLSSIDRELKPAMDDARAIIQKYAPTIAELARNAAEEIRELEKKTTEAADAAEQNPSTEDSEEQIKSLEKKQEQVNQKLDDLFEALVEDANKQDLLDANQIQRAKDADDSIDLVKQPAQEMNKALEKAAEQANNQAQAKELSKTAEKQEQTAQALDKVAQHFENLGNQNPEENPSNAQSIEQTRNELRDAAAQPSETQNSLEQQFSEAEKLAEMAQKPAAELLKELEAELQKNPEMKKSLSEIAKETIKDTEKALKEAAQRENNLQRANEQSDAEFQKQKDKLAQELRKVGAEAARIMQENVEQANRAAQQGKTTEAQRKLAEAQQELNKAAAQAQRAQPNQLLKELRKTADDAKSAIDKANQALEAAKKETEKGKDQQIHPDENARKTEQANFERHRKQLQDSQIRNAKQQTKQAESKKRQADNMVRSAENNLRNTMKRIDRAKQMLNQRPDDQNRQRMVAKEAVRKKADEQKLAKAKADQQKADAELKTAKEIETEANKKTKAALDAKNPATQFADELTKEAIDRTKKVQSKLNKLAQKSELEKQLKPSENQLANAQRQQEEITKNVDELAKDLQRAARHEKRLENQSAAQQLEQTAKAVQDAAEDESKDAEKQLGKAANEAKQPSASQPNKQNNRAENQQNKGKGQENEPNKSNSNDGPQKSGEPKKSKADSNPSKQDAGNKTDGNSGKQNSGADEDSQQAKPSAAQKAQESLEDAEKAFSNQADSLAKTLEDLPEQSSKSESQQNNSAQNSNEANQNGQPQNGQPQNGQPQNGQPQNGQPQNGQPQNGQPQNGQPQNGQSDAAAQAKGRQLAQTLDELDRQLAAGTQAGGDQPAQTNGDQAQASQNPNGQQPENQPGQGTPSENGQPSQALGSLTQAAQAQQAAMASARSQAQQQSQMAQSNQPSDSSMPSDSMSDPALTGAAKAYSIKTVERKGDDWGKLRGKSAEGNVAGQKDKVSKEYRKKVEAYFKVLAEQAKLNK